MLSGLILTAFLMGLGGAPHCATMCGVPCAAAFRRALPWQALLGRCVGYAVLGAVAAASAGAVSQWSREVAFLKPFWLIAQVLAVCLGIWLLISGRMPRQLDQWGLDLYHRLRGRWAQGQVNGAISPWVSQSAPFLAGMGWALLPCGLLYGAVTVAALAPNAWSGALVMATFALPSGVAVWAAPRLVQRLSRIGAGWQNPGWSIRLAGVMLAAMAGWGLVQHLIAQWRAWCG